MKEIQLTGGHVALVDNGDYQYLSNFKWYAHISKRGHITARRNKPRKEGGSRVVLMHRQILGVTDRYVFVDHIDHDPLNNQRSNIRLCTVDQNAKNQKPNRSGKSSKYKGVHQLLSGRWAAQIGVNGSKEYLGSHDTEELAGKAYDVAANKFHGEFALTNNLI